MPQTPTFGTSDVRTGSGIQKSGFEPGTYPRQLEERRGRTSTGVARVMSTQPASIGGMEERHAKWLRFQVHAVEPGIKRGEYGGTRLISVHREGEISSDSLRTPKVGLRVR